MKRPNCSTTIFLLSALVLLTLSAVASAYPLYGDLWELRQPRGDMVQVRIFGDEYYQVVESLDGYTLMRDPNTGVIVYANVSPDGTNLVSTGVEVGKQSPVALGLQQHLRITKESRYFKVKQARKAAQMTMPGEMPVSATPPPSTGNVLGLVLLVDFDDQTAIVAQSEVNNFCNQNGYSNNGNNGSIWNYFNDVSDGALNYTSWVMPSYYRADNDFTYYDDCAVTWLDRARELIKECLDDLEANGHDFSVYDSNGDGYIDALNLFYAGSTTCGWAKGMWPGSSGMKDQWSADGVATDRFQITGMGNSGNLSIGTYCHENGHMVGGFPDLYDYDGDSAGVGQWCIMAANFGLNPQEPCGYLKTTAGWATATTINAAQTVNVGPSSNNANLYKFPSGAPNEYFLIENRRTTARDAGLPTSGLMITHIDENGDHNANEMLPGSHFLVTVVQADGNWDLENNNNNGDSGDLYKSPTYPALTPCTDPNSDWWDGSASNYSFTTTDPSQDVMEVEFTTTDEAPVAVCQPFGHDGDSNCCIGVGVDDIDGGSYDPNGNGDIVSRKIVAVDGNPNSPANVVQVCGDGMHTVTLKVIDACGNESTCDADVEVINSPPVAVCQNYAADADPITCCITVHRNDVDGGFYDPDGEDDIASFGITAVDGNPVTLTNSVEICGNGTHTVELTMTDDCGKSSSCTADVEVIDVTPPTIDVSLNRYVLWPPNHKYMDISATVEVEDNCDANPDWWLDVIMSDEPDNGSGDGNTIEDISMADIGTPDTAFKLRSERQGNGDGRKYTIIYCAEDDSGNQACDTVCVIVPHDQGHPAMAANGYAAGGTAFKQGAETFMIVIPSTQQVVAADLDPAKVQIGNSEGVISHIQSQVIDVNNDGAGDLALTFRTIDAHNLAFAAWDNPIDDGLGKAATIGYHALYFMTENEDVWEVADIYALGDPITVTADRGQPGDGGDRPIWDKEDMPLKPVSSARYENGISSIYPNPFNPSTTIRYTVAEPGNVKIAIYDVKGSLVRLLVDQDMSAGEYNAPWNGTDSRGRVVATGVYFTRLLIGDFQETRKMVLLK